MSHSDREPVEFIPGDFVYLVTKGLRIHQQSNKNLRDMQLGPLSVSRKNGNRAYAIDLPRTFRLHNVFYVDVLRKASTPSPLQQGPLHVGPETEDAEGEEYIVEKISDVKLAPFGRRRGLWLQLLVHYASYPQPEWSLLSDVDDIEALIELITTVVVLRSQTRSRGTQGVLARVLRATSTGVPRVQRPRSLRRRAPLTVLVKIRVHRLALGVPPPSQTYGCLPRQLVGRLSPGGQR